MFRSQVVLIVAFVGAMAVCGPASAGLDAFIDPVGGGVWLVADSPTSMYSYEFLGPNDSFTYGAEWQSMSKQGVSGAIELEDTSGTNSLLSESIFTISFPPLDMAQDEILDLGIPYIGGPGVTSNDFSFAWGNGDTQEIVPGSVTIVPEPSTWLLLCCAGLGMLFFRRR